MKDSFIWLLIYLGVGFPITVVVESAIAYNTDKHLLFSIMRWVLWPLNFIYRILQAALS
jgi:hypothetical protein